MSVRPELVSIVVPTYGGRESLRPLLERLDVVMAGRDQDHEVIVVNDASPDDSWAVLQELIGDRPELVAIDLLTNHGQQRATMCGINHARGDVVVTMDDDLQHPPEELPKLLDALDANPEWDCVIGAWPRDEGWFRNFGSWVYATLDRIAYNTPKGFRYSGYRAFRRPVAAALMAHQTRYPVIGPLLRQCSNRVFNVEVDHHERELGQSGFQLRSAIGTVLANFFHGSTLPLRLLSRFGLVCAIGALLFSIYLLGRWVFGEPTLPGWLSSLLAIVFFGGASLFGLGILGEYMHLMMLEVRKPPQYRIRSELRGAARGLTAVDSAAPGHRS
jgi:glycosyltransferase involved in cell wall biosynthesis